MEIVTKASRVAKLKKRSANELGIFSRAIANLAKINSEITKEMDGNNAKIKELEGYNSTLNNLQSENGNVMTKFAEILGVKA